MTDWAIYELSPPSGTNWSCSVEADLRQIARYLRHVRCDITRVADTYEWVGYSLGFLAFMLAVLNTAITVPALKLLLAIVVGINAFGDLPEWALNAYDTSFEISTIIDSIRQELLLPVCARIDGVIYLQTIQQNRNAVLSNYRDGNMW